MIKIILIFVGGLLVVLFMASFFLPVGVTGSRVHGKAHFSKKKILKRRHKGLVIGTKRLSLSESFKHLLLVAPSGSGKTLSYIIQNILTLNYSQVISDVKGELLSLTYSHLIKKGFKIIVLDFTDVTSSAKYNFIQMALNFDSEIKQIARFLVAPNKIGTEQNKDDFWLGGGADIIEILLRCFKNIPTQYQTISTLIQLLRYVDDGSGRIERFVARHAPNTDTREMFMSWMSEEEKIKKGFLATAKRAVSPFDSKEMKIITSDHTISFQDFRNSNQPVALYLNLPPKKSKEFAPFLSIFYQQFFDYLLSTPINETDAPIFFLLDEFASLYLPNFNETIQLIRSQKCSLSLVIQNLSQLDHRYSSHLASTLCSNCGSFMVLKGVREERTLKYVQELAGNTTREVHRPDGSGVQLVSRPLLNKDDIRVLADNQAYFIHGNHYAQKIKIVPLYKNKQLMKHAGIRSLEKRLVSKSPYKAPTLADQNELNLRFPIEELVIDEPIKQYQKRLDNLLSKNN